MPNYGAHDMPTNGSTQRRRSASAKLTTAEVRQIRGMKGRCTQAFLAFCYDVSVTCISEIQRGESWRWLDQQARHHHPEDQPRQHRQQG